jgi:hypothetical protein
VNCKRDELLANASCWCDFSSQSAWGGIDE